MNDLAESILRGGRNSSDPLKGVFFRQFLPSTNVRPIIKKKLTEFGN